MGKPDMNSNYINHDLSNHMGFDRRFKYYQPVKRTWNIWTYVKYIRNELNPPLLVDYGWTPIFSSGFYRLVIFEPAVETHMVGKIMVNLLRTHIGFTHICPLEDCIRAFACFLLWFSRVLVFEIENEFWQHILQALKWVRNHSFPIIFSKTSFRIAIPGPRWSASAAIPSFRNWVYLPPVWLAWSALGLWILGLSQYDSYHIQKPFNPNVNLFFIYMSHIIWLITRKPVWKWPYSKSKMIKIY